MARIWITVDVEAQPNRAAEAHVERLIWGRFGGTEYGIGRMMDIADANNVRLTMFTDLSEIDRYGIAMIDAAEQVDRRGHDLQLHVHSEFFSSEIWKSAGVAPISNLNEVNAAQAEVIVEELVRRHKKITGRQPLAFRGGGYRFNEELLKALQTAGVRLDSSVNRSRKTQPFEIGPTKQFYWPNRILEIPISVVDNYKNNPNPFDFNFNSAYFPSHLEMLHFVELFENQFGAEAIIVLVMHSWSLLDISKGGYFGPPLESNVKKLEDFISAARQDHEFVTSSNIVDLVDGQRLSVEATIDPTGRGAVFWGLNHSAVGELEPEEKYPDADELETFDEVTPPPPPYVNASSRGP